MQYEGSYPFYGPTKRYTGLKLYAVHIWCLRPHINGGYLKRIFVYSVPDQPMSGFETKEDLDEFVNSNFLDKQMFQEWAKQFNTYGVNIRDYHRKNLKPYIFKKTTGDRFQNILEHDIQRTIR